MTAVRWARGRKKPYTDIGIRRMPCIRCGEPAATQWSICSDGNRQRPLCLRCDIALNRLVLEWANHPDVDAVMLVYEVIMKRKHGAPWVADNKDAP